MMDAGAHKRELPIRETDSWPSVSRIKMRLQVQLLMPRMRVRDVLTLQKGMLFHSGYSEANDVPLYVGGVLLSWCEFAAVAENIGVRLTRLG